MTTQLENMPKPAGESTEYTVTLFNGATRIVYDNDNELPYPDGKLIVSRTDLKGNITNVNDAFVEISGYTEEELIGKPHSILRHPEMPKEAYQDLWSTVQSGKKWHGYVKNLCKDGSHYWVYATVVPNVRRGETVGYTSVRRKPSRSKIQEAATQYLQMKAGE